MWYVCGNVLPIYALVGNPYSSIFANAVKWRLGDLVTIGYCDTQYLHIQWEINGIKEKLHITLILFN